MINTAAAFDNLYRQGGLLPWDLAGPTPFVRELQEHGDIQGDVLDAGCGTGENALYVASCGHRVLAVDGAPAAIEKARAKARARGIGADFRVADARRLPGFENCVDTIIDCGFFHVLDRKSDRRRYAAAVWRAGRQGAIWHLLAFRAVQSSRLAWTARLRTSFQRWRTGFGTHRVTERELRDAFRHGWVIDAVSEREEGGYSFYSARMRRTSLNDA